MLVIKNILGYLYEKFGTNIVTLALSKVLDRLVTYEQRKMLKKLNLNSGTD